MRIFCTFFLDSSIDFLNHYRLVDPMNLDGYAKAFVVEDTDYDTVLNSSVHNFFVSCSFSLLSSFEITYDVISLTSIYTVFKET